MTTKEYREKYKPRGKFHPAGSKDVCALCDQVDALAEALRWALEYIDAVPLATAAALPTMPGFDRDYVNELLATAGDKGGAKK